MANNETEIESTEQIAQMIGEVVLGWTKLDRYHWNDADGYMILDGEEFSPFSDWNHTMLVRDESAKRLKAEWNLVSGQWRLVRYENQWPITLAGGSYVNEKESISKGALNAVCGCEAVR